MEKNTKKRWILVACVIVAIAIIIAIAVPLSLNSVKQKITFDTYTQGYNKGTTITQYHNGSETVTNQMGYTKNIKSSNDAGYYDFSNGSVKGYDGNPDDKQSYNPNNQFFSLKVNKYINKK